VSTVTLTTAAGLDLFSMLGAVLWHSLRIGATLQVLPMIGGRSLPARVRLLTTLALAAAIAAMLPAPPPMAVDAATVLTVLRELAVGVATGLLLRLVFEAGMFAGELVSLGMGLSFATMADPLSGASSPVVSTWFYLLFGLLFFSLNAHLALVQLLFDSYHALPVGTPLADVNTFLAAAPIFFSTCLRSGLMIALPVMIALLAVNLAFGVLARAAAALNPIAIGLPVSLLVGLLLLMLLSRQMLGPVQALLESAFAVARALTG